MKVPADKNVTVRLRLTKVGAEKKASFADFASMMELRRKEACGYQGGTAAANLHLDCPEWVSCADTLFEDALVPAPWE